MAELLIAPEYDVMEDLTEKYKCLRFAVKQCDKSNIYILRNVGMLW
jgi:hypothetical protein